MSDYGFRISQTGFDVKTATESQLVITSKRNSLKIQNNLQGSTTITVNAGADYNLTIAHNLGYIPAFDAWYYDENNLWHTIFTLGRSNYTPNIYAPSGSNQNADSTNVNLKLHNRGAIAHTVKVYYMIFLNPM